MSPYPDERLIGMPATPSVLLRASTAVILVLYTSISSTKKTMNFNILFFEKSLQLEIGTLYNASGNLAA